MIFGKKDIDREVIIENKKIENVREFTYLGSVITWDNNCMKDIKTRIAKAKGIMAGLNSIWQSKRVDYITKMRIMKSCVWNVGLYACETWTLNKSHQDRLLAFEMYCYRRVLKLNWTHKVTNIEVRRRLNIK